MSSYIVKEPLNVVQWLARSFGTDRHTYIDILLLHYKDILINNVNKIFEFSENKYIGYMYYIGVMCWGKF